MIDLTFKKYKVGTQVKTKKGFVWTKAGKHHYKLWKDETSGLLWYPEKTKKMNHYDAMKLEDAYRRLPTKEEYEEAERHGVREVLNMHEKWFWSSSIYPINHDYACGFSGYYGDVTYDPRNGDYGSVLLVNQQ